MQKIYRLSAYETTAAEFFQRVAAEETDLVLDVRLNNSSQLCGFTKKKDLEFFVPKLSGAKYVHDLLFAPDKGLLELYTKKRIGWEEYSDAYDLLLDKRKAMAIYAKKYKDFACVCLLGTQTKKRRSHNEILYRRVCGL